MPECAVLAARIRQESKQLGRIVSRVQTVAGMGKTRSAGRTPIDEIHVESIALNLQSFYTGTERIFSAIASSLDKSLPTGADWHRQLLQQMTLEINGIRPAVLSQPIVHSLDEFLRFRHVMRSLYAFELNEERIRDLVRKLPSTFDGLQADLKHFTVFLDEISANS